MLLDSWTSLHPTRGGQHPPRFRGGGTTHPPPPFGGRTGKMGVIKKAFFNKKIDRTQGGPVKKPDPPPNLLPPGGGVTKLFKKSLGPTVRKKMGKCNGSRMEWMNECLKQCVWFCLMRVPLMANVMKNFVTVFAFKKTKKMHVANSNDKNLGNSQSVLTTPQSVVGLLPFTITQFVEWGRGRFLSAETTMGRAQRKSKLVSLYEKKHGLALQFFWNESLPQSGGGKRRGEKSHPRPATMWRIFHIGGPLLSTPGRGVHTPRQVRTAGLRRPVAPPTESSPVSLDSHPPPHTEPWCPREIPDLDWSVVGNANVASQH